MNIREELERELTKNQILTITEYACSTTTRFRKLMDCFFDPYHRIVLNATWIVTQSLELHKEMLVPYIPVLVAQITKPNNAEHLIRNSLRILELIEIPEAFHGLIMNTYLDLSRIQKQLLLSKLMH